MFFLSWGSAVSFCKDLVFDLWQFRIIEASTGLKDKPEVKYMKSYIYLIFNYCSNKKKTKNIKMSFNLTRHMYILCVNNAHFLWHHYEWTSQEASKQYLYLNQKQRHQKHQALLPTVSMKAQVRYINLSIMKLVV